MMLTPSMYTAHERKATRKNVYWTGYMILAKFWRHGERGGAEAVLLGVLGGTCSGCTVGSSISVSSISLTPEGPGPVGV